MSDKKIGIPSTTNPNIIDHYEADVVSASDYYPFGMQMPGRSFSVGSYRYGFNGKENDNEVKGDGNQIDYGWRVYDPRIGKFLSVDPLQSTYPELTPYQFAGNTPIQAVDLDGREIYHYTLFFQTDGKAPILTYVGEQKNEVGTWPLDAIDRGKSEGFKTYNGDNIPTKSIQVHVVAVEGGGIAYKPAEATVTFSSFKAMNDWSAAGYGGTDDEIAFIGGFQQKLEVGVVVASVTAPSASPVGKAAGARQSPSGTTAKQATAVNGRQLTKAEMENIKGGSASADHHIATNKNSISTARGGPWTPKFESFFKKAGLNINKGSENLVNVLNHKGPHPEAYHKLVFDRLTTATQGLKANTAAYKTAVTNTLQGIGKEAQTSGSTVNKLLTQ